MRKIREVLRLKAEGFSDRQIAAAIGSARSTVQECVRRAREADLTWPLPPAMDEAGLHARMYRRVVPLSRTPRPDFAYLHEELRRRGVTWLLLSEEYKAAHPDGWQYSVFCDQYRRWLATQNSCCARNMRRATSCSSIMPARRYRSPSASRARLARHRSLSLCWGIRTTRTPKRP